MTPGCMVGVACLFIFLIALTFSIAPFRALALGWLRWEFHDYHTLLIKMGMLGAAATLGYFLHWPATITVERIVTQVQYVETPAKKPEPTPEQIAANAHKEDVIIALRNMERGRRICADHHHEMRWYLRCYDAGVGEFQGLANEFYDARGRHKPGKTTPCEHDVLVCDQWVTRK